MVGQEDWSALIPMDRALRLKAIKINVLLCGAISCRMEDLVRRQGIQLIAWLAGDVPAILKAFGDGTIMEPQYAMPGTQLCRRRRHIRHRRLGQNQTRSLKTKEDAPCQG
jgi:predicted Fe-Mo cluster-binding NifX family protein